MVVKTGGGEGIESGKREGMEGSWVGTGIREGEGKVLPAERVRR
jgi:hypothetical protein